MRRDLKSEEEIILHQFCSDLRLLPCLDAAGEFGRGEGLKGSLSNFFFFLILIVVYKIAGAQCINIIE